MYFNEAANAEQRAQLEPILKGKKGGQLKPLGALIPIWLPTMGTKMEREQFETKFGIVANVYWRGS